LRVVISSWSKNWKKGFRDYQWLDENLDFSRFEVTFIGNSPVLFRNIRMVAPLSPEKLADQLREHDAYLTATEQEACSNSLLEALHCGLPCIAKNDGGTPELVGSAGELFLDVREVPALLAKLHVNLDAYRSKIRVATLDEIARKYLRFIESLPAPRRSRLKWAVRNTPKLAEYVRLARG
jgi:glycosyltransferase involved in cell wall biosynthesis